MNKDEEEPVTEQVAERDPRIRAAKGDLETRVVSPIRYPKIAEADEEDVPAEEIVKGFEDEKA